MSEQDEDFAAMFEASIKAKRGSSAARPSTARSSASARTWPSSSIGGKSEAQIDLDELKDDEGDVEVSVGDRIQAVVVSTAGGIRSRARACATPRRSASSRTPTEAGLAGRRQGREGGEGRLRGAHRPRSAPSARCRKSTSCAPRTRRCTSASVYAFRIIEYKEGGRNLVVSRRAQLEEEQQRSAAEVRESIVPGAVLHGRVASVREFGAFVDLGGGIQGLLHVSDMGWSRVTHPASWWPPAIEITVKVLRVDEATAEDLARPEAAAATIRGRRSAIDLRGRPGAHRPRHAGRRFRRVRRARAGHRRAGARVDVPADRAAGRMDEPVAAGHDRRRSRSSASTRRRSGSASRS